MNIQYGKGTTKYGPGVSIELTGNEVANAIDAWLVAHGVDVWGIALYHREWRAVRMRANRCEPIWLRNNARRRQTAWLWG